MSYALELQDRALAIARNGAVLSVAPSANTGRTDALWLAEAELRARLAAVSVHPDEAFWCVTSAAVDPGSLGTILALARRAGAAVGGFIDSAAVSAAPLDLQHDALVFEMGLRHLAVTSVAAGQLIRKRRSVISRQGGWFALCDAWLALIRSIMVNRMRIDPLRDADAERRLFDSLPALAHEAATHGTAFALVAVNGQTTEIPVTRDQLAAAAEAVTRELSRLIAQLRTPGIAVDIIAPLEMATLPGLDAVLASLTRTGGRQLLLPDGFAAAAASLRDPPASPQSEVVPFVQRAPVASHEALRALVVHRESRLHESRTRPSHVLYQGRAVALREGPVVVGRAAAGNTIVLPDSAAGVSRRHCTFLSMDDDVALVDHSRFGTFVNGERIIERARIHAGDRIQIGEPGLELAVIAVEQT